MIFEYNGKNIGFSVIGNGMPVVMIHGFLESRDMWDAIIPHFSNCCIITLDLPGMGESDPIASVHTMELMAETVQALLNHLKVEEAVFVGHSMGGYITLACAELFPERILKIILLNSTFRTDDETRKENRIRGIEMLKSHPKAYISMAIGNYVSEASRERFAEKINFMKTQAYQFPVEGIIAALKGMAARKDRSEVLKNFPKPKYLLLAEEDPLIPAKDTALEAEQLGVSTQIISGGHLSQVENLPEVVAFLKEAF